MTNQFAAYNLSQPILDALTLLGYTTPTPIQEAVIPAALNGRDIAARSQTGTGKTLAFAVPICEKAVWEENLPQALVLEPTRELAVQVSRELFQVGRKKRLKVPAVFGGFPIDKQIRTLKQKSHIVVGTPGRVMDHLRRGSLCLSTVRFLVIDEADLMLDMGFLEDVQQILSMLPNHRTTFLFSATLDGRVQELTEAAVSEAVFISMEDEVKAPPAIEQSVYQVLQEEKYGGFKNILIKENPDRCMIFCGTREMVNVLFQKLRRDRIFCGMIHGEMEQAERLKHVDAFRQGGFRYLIATDVAARGIDFEGISLVVNYDFMDAALPLLPLPEPDEAEEKAFWALQRKKAEPRAGRDAALNHSILRLSIGGGRKSKMRTGDIVGTICSIDGVAAEDIGIIDVRESLTYVEILNQKGPMVLEQLQSKTIKGKVRKVRAAGSGLI